MNRYIFEYCCPLLGFLFAHVRAECVQIIDGSFGYPPKKCKIGVLSYFCTEISFLLFIFETYNADGLNPGPS